MELASHGFCKGQGEKGLLGGSWTPLHTSTLDIISANTTAANIWKIGVNKLAFQAIWGHLCGAPGM